MVMMDLVEILQVGSYNDLERDPNIGSSQNAHKWAEIQIVKELKHCLTH